MFQPLKVGFEQGRGGEGKGKGGEERGGKEGKEGRMLRINMFGPRSIPFA